MTGVDVIVEFISKISEPFKEHELYYYPNEWRIITYDDDYFRADYYDRDLNVVVEFYGDRWHKDKVERDEMRKNKIMKTLGCKFIVAWGHAYCDDKDKVVEKVINLLKDIEDMPDDVVID